MAIEQHYRIRYIDLVRQGIGDVDGILFNEDELLSVIETYMFCQLQTVTLTANNNRYRLYCTSPIYQYTVSSGDDGAVYILDEKNGWVIFDPLDPDNTATDPVDGTTITVQYYRICHASVMSELFFILSSNHAKLKSSQSIAGIQMDLKDLSDGFYNQSVRWEAEKLQGGYNYYPYNYYGHNYFGV